MELIARLGERIERVSIERHGDVYRIRVGERDYEVESRSLGPFVQSLRVGAESHETALFRRGERGWSVGWLGRSVELELVDPLAHLAEQAHGEAGRHGRMVVSAYMPGRVVAVRTAVGEHIEAGQPLVVLEAMKMQNEIQSDRAGVVRVVHVSEGEAVEGGDPLVEIE
ncbi:MAG TPA: acetyl-CoA carboxylase biotin carboxyl carrier protein subunit [Thermoanaerobaculia bacterium]|jgi:biotin carboxyl carrier protein|nr:acetyl-CoA carboxylase biotin carboxyl carrier protein subunit [Thermoanaerobaculia bacterium]